eukprot:15485116-Alexandrium_andersonii.AAC.1
MASGRQGQKDQLPRVVDTGATFALIRAVRARSALIDRMRSAGSTWSPQHALQMHARLTALTH